MPAKTSTIGAPPVAQSLTSNLSTRKWKAPASATLIEANLKPEEKPASGTSININTAAETRAILAHGICSTRLEILALSDFQPLYQGSEKTLAGNLLDVRYAKRNLDIDSVSKLIQELKNNNPEAYQNALDIYKANQQSVSLEIELLKSAYLMKEYGARAFSYMSHLESYLVPDLGSAKAKSLYNLQLGFDAQSEVFARESTTLFAQLVSDLALFSRSGFPKVLKSKKRNLSSGAITSDVGVISTPSDSASYFSVRVARELASSLKIQEIATYTGEDKQIHAKFKSVLGQEFFSTSTIPDFSVFEKLYGIDSWFDESKLVEFSLKGKGLTQINSLYESESLVGKLDIPERNTLMLEDGIRTYGGVTYLPASSLVNTAFKPKSPLNFSIYSEAARAFYQSCLDSSNLHSQLYFPRFKAKPPATTSFSAGQRISPAAVFQETLNVFNAKFASTIHKSLYSTSIKSDQDLVDYARNIAHVFIRDEPNSAAKILSMFLSDYSSGRLSTGRSVSSAASSFSNVSVSATINIGSFSSLASAKKILQKWLTSREAVTTKVASYTVKSKKSSRVSDYDIETNITTDSDFRNNLLVSSGESSTFTYEDILVFEVIEYAMSVFRNLLSRFETIDQLTPEDSFWPFTGDPDKQISNADVPPPYDSPVVKLYSSKFSTEYWIPTIRAVLSKFFRGSTSKSWMSSMSFEQLAYGIYKIHSNIMLSGFGRIKAKVRKFQKSSNSVGASMLSIYGYLAIDKNESTPISSTLNDAYSEYLKTSPQVLSAFLASNSLTYTSVYSKISGSQSYVRLISNLVQSTKGSIATLLEDDVSLKSSIGILQSFGQRAKSYSENMIDTFTGGNDDENAVYTLATQLVTAGNSGLDILENLTPEQLLLKRNSLSRQTGSPRNYVPLSAIISRDEKLAIQTLASSKSLKAPEGLNLRCLTVGLPAGSLRNLEIKEKFSIGVRLSDIEFGDLVFKPKFFNFDSSLFIGPEGFRGVRDFSSFESLVEQTAFYYSKFSVNEIPGTIPRLSKTDTQTLAKPSSSNFDVFSNTAASYILELYYKLLVGIDLNEDTFLSVRENIGVPLNKYAGNLAAALASISADLAPKGSNRASYYKNVSDLTTETNAKRSLKIDSFDEIDAEFLASVRNAYSTRLLSAEDMRDTILKAKMFDRVIHLLLDPDEFEIATSSTGPGKPFTTSNTISKYLNKGIVERILVNGQEVLKLAPRKVADGRMAFCKFMCSIEPASANGSLVVR